MKKLLLFGGLAFVGYKLFGKKEEDVIAPLPNPLFIEEYPLVGPNPINPTITTTTPPKTTILNVATTDSIRPDTQLNLVSAISKKRNVLN